MFIKEITITKSMTVGIESENKTRYRKIVISAVAGLDEKDNPDISYKKLSDFIDDKILKEKKIKIKQRTKL